MRGSFSPSPYARYEGELDRRVRDQSTVAALSVTVVEGVMALDRHAHQIDRLNLAAARPNPFNSSAFLRTYALRSEFFRPGREERLYLIRSGNRLVGCVPMRLSKETVRLGAGLLHFNRVRLQFLAPIDVEQPGLLCAPEHQQLVAGALVRYLCQHERGWDLLDFVGQRAGSALRQALDAAAGKSFRTRDIAVEPYHEIPIIWTDLHAYFRSLAKKMRSNISRQARRLFAAGEVEIVLAHGPEAVAAWFDAYRDLDGRSWKHGTKSSIEREPRRVRFYREVVSGRAGLDPEFIGIIFDGVLVAGLLTGSNECASPASHGAWCLEMAYDQTQSHLGPGQLLLLLAVGQAIQRGHRFLNFMQNFAYYKHRWGAVPIEVANMQLIRRASLYNAVAGVGEALKRWRSRADAPAVDAAPESNADAAAVCASEGDGAGGDRVSGGSVPTIAVERARRLARAALSFDGPGIERLGRAAAKTYLPFELD